MKKACFFLVMLVSLVVLSGTLAETMIPEDIFGMDCRVTPTRIKISGSKYVAKGKVIKLQATVFPKNANQKVKWSSSDKKIATVNSKGEVKGIAVTSIGWFVLFL